MTRVFDSKILPPAEKLVLLSMADAASEDGANSYQSLPTVSRKTGFTTRGVEKIVARLRRAGFIAPVGKKKFHSSAGSDIETVNYTLTLQNGSIEKLKQIRSEERIAAAKRQLPCPPEPGSPLPPNGDSRAREPGSFYRPNRTARKPEPGSSNPNALSTPAEIKSESGCRSPIPSQDTRSKHNGAGKAERQFLIELNKTAKNKAMPGKSWLPRDPLRAEFRRGIYPDKVENVFFDSRKMALQEQIGACVANLVS